MNFELRAILWLGAWLVIIQPATALGIWLTLALAVLSASWLTTSGLRQFHWEWRRRAGIKQQLRFFPRRLRFAVWRWRIAQQKDKS